MPKKKKAETKPKTDTKPKGISKPKAAKFKVRFSPNAQMQHVAAIERELRKMGGKSIQQKAGYFTVSLKWGTSSGDRANLAGHLNLTANGAVVNVENG